MRPGHVCGQAGSTLFESRHYLNPKSKGALSTSAMVLQLWQPECEHMAGFPSFHNTEKMHTNLIPSPSWCSSQDGAGSAVGGNARRVIQRDSLSIGVSISRQPDGNYYAQVQMMSFGHQRGEYSSNASSAKLSGSDLCLHGQLMEAAGSRLTWQSHQPTQLSSPVRY